VIAGCASPVAERKLGSSRPRMGRTMRCPIQESLIHFAACRRWCAAGACHSHGLRSGHLLSLGPIEGLATYSSNRQNGGQQAQDSALEASFRLALDDFMRLQ